MSRGMAIVSISLNDKILTDIDELQEELGFSGRSEVIRAALRLMLAEKQEKAQLTGTIDAILLTIREEKYSDEVSHIRHAYEKLIKTQIHNHLENGKCLDIFVVRGDAKKIRKLSEAFQVSKKIEFAKLFVA